MTTFYERLLKEIGGDLGNRVYRIGDSQTFHTQQCSHLRRYSPKELRTGLMPRTEADEEGLTHCYRCMAMSVARYLEKQGYSIGGEDDDD